MIKLMALGLWVCAVTLASCFAALSWRTGKLPQPGTLGLFDELATVRTPLISVPIIAEGAVQGYVITRLAFTVDAALVKRISVKPELILVDEAIRTIYAGKGLDFRHMTRQDLPGLAKALSENANARFGMNLVADVHIQEINYVTKDMVRNGRSRGAG